MISGPVPVEPNANNCAALARLHAQCFADRWSAKEFGELLSGPGTFAVACGGPPPNGFVVVRGAADECEILTLAVDPACRRRGLARALVIEALRLASTAGARKAYLEVAESNMPAISLYAALGFEILGTRQNYYQKRDSTPEHALVFGVGLPLPAMGKSAGIGYTDQQEGRS